MVRPQAARSLRLGQNSRFSNGLGLGADAFLANETMGDQLTCLSATRASRQVQLGGFAQQFSIQYRGCADK
jgi:hypothetical protein